MRNLIFTFLFLTFFTGSFAQEVKEIQWDDLVPDEVKLDDPFEKLTEDQIDDLRYIVRMRMLQERKPGSVGAESLKTIEEKEKKLTAEGVDIDGMLAQHTAITEFRKKSAEGVVDSLNGVNIRMSGFLLPLDFDGKNGVEFLLVPWVGACIHTPPPPANQIVFIKFDNGFEMNSLFAPVWVEGTLITKRLTKELYLADGESEINVGYAMSAKKILDYKKK
ncbi:hypothetical protein SAMN06265375_1067 [Muriicola jejuensis]|uniref:DUF3299 domain-containing protein n=1 Tax=Muriicola jejuensis TaxID=504488 RepID=A0A6P0U6Z8_9FLAO|nr:DUF3299 domain-containing protein [Muriicola jejuensis]NER08895.1 DUF3299 domain-containing protein [Muriicola jejuensis]SMP26168.1 hypothetical protein SAMN06265375_1067 [Muriicola jejuensis]